MKAKQALLAVVVVCAVSQSSAWLFGQTDGEKLKELIPEAVQRVENPNGESGCTPTREVATGLGNSFAGCPFLARDRQQKLLRPNWALEASGADLLRDDPAVREAAHYENQQLAIVDTGLRAKNNPDAGPLLAELSPEIEADGHGTHVAGIAVSWSFGVNPLVHVAAYPVPYNSGQDLNRIFEARGFDHAGLLNQMREAATNPKVGVINLSMSSAGDPELADILFEAQKNGKWIVYAGGNETAMNDKQNAGWEKLQNSAALFTVGSLSYFGGPSHFSNYGPRIQFFAPGSQIRSLSSNYNPNVADSETSVIFGGTSMASPHFSAILSTLRAMRPSFTAEQAHELLVQTAIHRGTKPAILVANGYLAARTLDAAKNCLDAGKKASGCFEEARAQLRRNLKISSPPRLKPGEDVCAAYENYYRELRRAYFLSQGDARSAQSIAVFFRDVGDSRWAEHFYFADGASLATALAGFEPQVLPASPEYREYAATANFLAGGQQATDELSESEWRVKVVRDPRGFLKNLPAKPENLKKYLLVCWEFLHAKSISELLESSCRQFITDGSANFRKALGEYLVKEDMPIADGTAAFWLNLDGNEELYRKVLSLAVRGWDIRADLEKFKGLRIRIFDLTQNDRDRLIETFQKFRQEGRLKGDIEYTPEYFEKTYLDLLSYGSPREIEGHEKAILASLNPGQEKYARDPATAKFIFESRRYKVGFGSKKRMLEAFKELLAKAENPATRDGAREFGDEQFNSYSLLMLIENPEMASEIADILARGKNLPLWFDIGRSDMVTKIMAKVDDARASALLESIRRNSNDSEFVSRGLGFSGRTSLYCAVLQASADLPVSKRELERLASGPQEDPVLQKARLELLNAQANGTIGLPAAKTYLAEVPGGADKHLIDLNVKVVLSDAALAQIYQTQLTEAANGKRRSDEYLRMAGGASVENFEKIAGFVAENLVKLVKNANDLSNYDIRRLLERFIAEKGADRGMMEALLVQVKQGLRDESFRSPTDDGAPRREYSNLRDEMLIELYQLIGRGSAGAEVLAADGELAQFIAKYVIDQSKGKKKGGRFTINHNFPIPQPLRDALIESLPSVEFFADCDIPPRWLTELITQDRRARKMAVKYIQASKSDRFKRDIAYAINETREQ